MAAGRSRRIGVIGATGAVGADVLELLAERQFPVAELIPVATDASLGKTVEFHGESYPVESELRVLRGLDLLFLCTPRPASLDWVRSALQAEVPCIDLSGAVTGVDDVPVLAADLAPSAEQLARPVVSGPVGPALAWALVLAPIHRALELQRVVGTSLQSASSAGRHGVEALQSEVVALFNQAEPPEPELFPAPIAFDCLPDHPGGDERGHWRAHLGALLGDVPVAITDVTVPTFAGLGASLVIETGRTASPEELLDLLAKAPGLDLWDDALPGPTTRDPTGRELVLVGRVREDPSRAGGLQLWISADPVRLAAANAVRLAEARLGRA